MVRVHLAAASCIDPLPIDRVAYIRKVLGVNGMERRDSAYTGLLTGH